MSNYTINPYEMKRNLANFLLQVLPTLKRPDQRFIADMVHGIMQSESLVVSSIARNLNNTSTLKTNFKRIQRHLKTFDETEKLIPAYHQSIEKILGEHKIFLVDDSDIIKPYGKVFESLGRVRDGSKNRNRTFENGYHVSQIVGLSETTLQPIPVAHDIYSEKEREFQSANYHTFKNISQVLNAFRYREDEAKCTFVLDRGYDDGKIMKNFLVASADYVLRVCSNRKYLIKDKKYTLTEVMDKYKGKYKYSIEFQGDYFKREVTLSCVNVQLLDETLPEMSLVLVYGISEKPMALLTNRLIDVTKEHLKKEVIKTFKYYFLRWRIEEYFRSTKQIYGFENMRVQTLKRMNTLSWMLQLVMGYQAYFIETQRHNALFKKMQHIAQAYKQKVSVWFYQTSYSFSRILLKARQNLHEMLGLKRTTTNPIQAQLF